MAFFIFFVLFVFPFLQAGPLDNWASFLAWAIFIIIPLIVTVLLCITTAHEDDNDSKKNLWLRILVHLSSITTVPAGRDSSGISSRLQI